MKNRHEPDYENLRAEEFFEGRPEEPNAYRALHVLWPEVIEVAAEIQHAFNEDSAVLAPRLLELHLALSSYALRQGVFIHRTILEKYPSYCPYCQYRECACHAISMGQEERNPTPPSRELIIGHVRPEMAQRLIIRIYGQANAHRTTPELWQRIREELEEVQVWINRWKENGDFLDQTEATQFKFELADTMAHIHVLLDRVGVDIGNTLASVPGPPYKGTTKPTIVRATDYTPLPEL